MPDDKPADDDNEPAVDLEAVLKDYHVKTPPTRKDGK